MTEQGNTLLMGTLDSLTTYISCEWQMTNFMLFMVMLPLLNMQDITKEFQHLEYDQVFFKIFFNPWPS